MEVRLKRMEKCIKAERDYFEGEKFQFSISTYNKDFTFTVSILFKQTTYTI